MKRTIFIKSFLAILPSLFISVYIFSQDCFVEKQELKGVYTGDCKKGKASGKGKAVGTDTYEGDFKSGVPDGEGIYTFKNGDVFKGHFSKGYRDGKGIFVYKRTSGDSTVEGYWKKDDYVGKFKDPYTIYFKTALVTETEVQYTKDQSNQITFNVTSTSGGDQTINGPTPKMKVDEIQLVTGHYGRTANNYNHAKSVETDVYMVMYPTRMRVLIGHESLEIEFREPGSYVVDIHINQ